MSTKLSFSSSDAIIESGIDVSKTQIDIDLDTYFDIDKCVGFIKENNYNFVALQFPDELMSYAHYVYSKLETKVEAKVYILADTSYGSCCVDEVAAAHVQADAIIHFGHSCLSGTQNLPVLYVFGRTTIDCENLLSEAKTKFPLNEYLLIFYDVEFHHSVQNLKQKFSQAFCNSCFTELKYSSVSEEKFESEFQALNLKNSELKQSEFLGRKFLHSRDITIYKVLFIGSESITLKNLMLTLNKNQFYTYNPKTKCLRRETLNVNRTLMRRYYLIEKAKDANIVGILMGTLGVKRYIEMVERLKLILKKAGKKYYMFLVGKVNVAKLANFMEIDMFVLIACPDNSLIDSKEFYKPIVTPYEMEIACLKAREWTGDYITDFRELLPGSVSHVDASDDRSDDLEPEYSLITGQLRSRISDNVDTSTDLMLCNNMQLTTKQPMTATEYLLARSWKGLDNEGAAEVKKVEMGREGIAMSYTHEPNQ